MDRCSEAGYQPDWRDLRLDLDRLQEVVLERDGQRLIVSYLRRQRIVCAKTTGYLEAWRKEIGKSGKIRKSAGFRRHDADVAPADSHGSGKSRAARYDDP